MSVRHGPGRPRDRALDDRIVDAAARLLREDGLDRVTYERVAERAGTTRQSLYRRYPTLTGLLVDAVAHLATTTAPTRTAGPVADPFADLVAELDSFRTAVSEARSVALVGDMLGSGTDPAVVATYRARVVAPRRARLRAILDDAVAAGQLDADHDDRAVAVSMCTGSWYALALAGSSAPDDWAERTARLVWRSLGGAPVAGPA